MTIRRYRFKLRRASAAQWTASNEVLLDGEPGIEQAAGVAPDKLKIGDGVTAWSALPYSPSDAVGGAVDSVSAADGTIVVAGTAADPTLAVGAVPQTSVANLVPDLAGKQATIPAGTYADYTEGTAAARPAAVAVPNKTMYLATDIAGGTLYRSNGSTWLQIAAGVTTGLDSDTGWVNATLNAGWTNFGGVWQVMRYRKLNGVVFVEGFVQNSLLTDNIGSVFTLPAGSRPAARIINPDYGGWYVTVGATGNVGPNNSVSASGLFGFAISFAP